MDASSEEEVCDLTAGLEAGLNAVAAVSNVVAMMHFMIYLVYSFINMQLIYAKQNGGGDKGRCQKNGPLTM